MSRSRRLSIAERTARASTFEDRGPEDVDAAVRAARKAFEEGSWGRMQAIDRGRVLLRLALRVQDNADELACLEARDTGKPMKQARADMVAVARYFEYYGAAADKLHG